MTSHTTTILPTTTPSSRRSHPSQALKSFATSNIHSNSSHPSAFEVAIETLFRQVNERLEGTNNQKERNHSQLLIGQIEREHGDNSLYTKKRVQASSNKVGEKRKLTLFSFRCLLLHTTTNS
jgi:hypothetical protein